MQIPQEHYLSAQQPNSTGRPRRLSPKTVPGRMAPAGEPYSWNHFVFTPHDGTAPIVIRVRPNSTGFLLHGIIHLQPELTVEVDIAEGHPVVFVAAAPLNAFEWVFDDEDGGQPEPEDGNAPQQASVTEVGCEHAVEMGPEARKNCRPVYSIAGCIADVPPLASVASEKCALSAT